MFAPKYNKFWVALGAFIAQVVQLNVIPEPYIPWVTAIIAALTALGVYQIPNIWPADDTVDTL
jgi:hypothetical protein